jgi:UDP-N-acetylglucosamine 2-epimerase (non-hydrolysing)
MPEEINRILTDSVCDHFFTTSQHASDNLKTIGIPSYKIHFVGNTMIDTLIKERPRFRKPLFWDDLGLKNGKYIVMTLHRPANVDEEVKLKELLDEIINNSNGLTLIFPVHPRTNNVLSKNGFYSDKIID